MKTVGKVDATSATLLRHDLSEVNRPVDEEKISFERRGRGREGGGEGEEEEARWRAGLRNDGDKR